MSAPDDCPCARCGALPERTGDFNDYLQCTNPACSQHAFGIEESSWPRLLSLQEMQKASDESEE